MGKFKDSMLVHQRLGFVGFSALLILVTALAPLAMDMFSPSIPTMTVEFGEPESRMTLTISIFFLFFAIGQLFSGTVSDKLGRKPVLIGCMLLFTVGSALCAMSTNLDMLICMRVIQAIGGGGESAVAIAVLRDVFPANMREKFLVYMTVVQVIAPVAAPIIGGWIVAYATWQMVFWVLTIVGVVSLAGLFLFNETLPKDQRLTENMFASYGHMLDICKDKAFMGFMLATLLPQFAFSGYLSVGSYIYMDQLGLDAQTYGVYFGATAILSVAAPVLYSKLAGRVSRKRIITGILVLPIVAAALIFLFGHVSALCFLLCFLPTVYAASMMRPAVTSILLQEKEDDAGSASGLINFSNSIGGAIGMAVASFFAFDFIYGIAIMSVFSVVVSLSLWAAFLKSGMKLRGLN